MECDILKFNSSPWPSDMNSDKEEETFYTGKGYQPNPRKEGFHEQVYSAFAIFADDF